MAEKRSVKKKEKTAASCSCPYCETEIMKVNLPFCKSCGLEIHRCVSCMIVLPKDAKICPRCGKAV